jgi:hypothetical protein
MEMIWYKIFLNGFTSISIDFNRFTFEKCLPEVSQVPAVNQPGWDPVSHGEPSVLNVNLDRTLRQFRL